MKLVKHCFEHIMEYAVNNENTCIIDVFNSTKREASSKRRVIKLKYVLIS